jgi:hypothetical protein
VVVFLSNPPSMRVIAAISTRLKKARRVTA